MKKLVSNQIQQRSCKVKITPEKRKTPSCGDLTVCIGIWRNAQYIWLHAYICLVGKNSLDIFLQKNYLIVGFIVNLSHIFINLSQILKCEVHSKT